MQNTQIPTLPEAAAALVAVDDAGLLADLKDEINAVRFRHRIDRQRQAIGMTPWLLLLAGELSRMTGLPRSDCEHAMHEAIGTDWPAVAIDEIIDYAERLTVAERRSA